MKKIVILAIATVALTIVSCKKERTCSCTITSTSAMNGVSVSSTSTSKDKYEKVSKKEIRRYEGCVSMTSSQTFTSGMVTTSTTDCTIE